MNQPEGLSVVVLDGDPRADFLAAEREPLGADVGVETASARSRCPLTRRNPPHRRAAAFHLPACLAPIWFTSDIAKFIEHTKKVGSSPHHRHALRPLPPVHGDLLQAPFVDVLVGPAALAADQLGISKLGRVRERLGRLIVYGELIRDAPLAAVVEAETDPSGIVLAYSAAANAGKFHFASGFMRLSPGCRTSSRASS